MSYKEDYPEEYEEGRMLARLEMAEKMIARFPLPVIQEITELTWEQLLQVVKEYAEHQKVSRST